MILIHNKQFNYLPKSIRMPYAKYYYFMFIDKLIKIQKRICRRKIIFLRNFLSKIRKKEYYLSDYI